MAQGVFDGRLEVSELAAAVVAFAGEAVGVYGLLAHERRDPVGELDLPARSLAAPLQVLENRRRQHVAADYGEIGRGVRGLGLLDDALHAARDGIVAFDGDD